MYFIKELELGVWVGVGEFEESGVGIGQFKRQLRSPGRMTALMFSVILLHYAPLKMLVPVLFAIHRASI